MKRKRGTFSEVGKMPRVLVSLVLAILGSAGCAGSRGKPDPVNQPTVIMQPEFPGVAAPGQRSEPVATATSGGPQALLACTFKEAAMSEAARSLINEGVALHDRGDYAGAARKYQGVLAQDPENLLALYELASTESVWGHDKDAVEHAGAGTRCRSPYRPGFYLTLGSALDNLSNPSAAIAAFEEGLRQSLPAEADAAGSRQMLHYNLALTLLRQHRFAEAQRHAENAALMRPGHSSPYLVLKLFDLGVDRDKRIITLDPATSASSEGDFKGLEAFLGLVTAAGIGKPELENRKQQINVLAELSDKPPPGEQSFSIQHNGPFLAALEKQQFVEPLAQLLLALGGNDTAQAWVRANVARVAAMVNFARSAKE